MIGVRLGVGHHFSGGFDSSAQAFFTATGITGTTEQQAVNTLVTSLKSAGLWSKMKAVYPFVTDNRNLLSYTEDFGNAYWGKYNATVTTNSVNAPNGTLTADTATMTTDGYISRAVTQTGSVTYSCYAKKKTDSICFFGVYDGATRGIWFNFDTGAITQTSGTISNQLATSEGNGWYRLSFTFSRIDPTAYINAPYPVTASGGFTRATDIYIWGAQLDAGSTLTTYQPIATTQQSYISNQFKYNLVNPVDSDAAFRGVFNGGWTFSNQGATPNGTNGYMDTKLVPLSALTNNNVHFSYYSRTNSQSDGFIGSSSESTTNGVQFYLRGGTYTNQIHASIGKSVGNSTLQNIIATNTNSQGFYTVKRLSDVNSSLFKNGVSIGTNSTAVIGDLTPYSIYLGARNFVGGPNLYDNRQAAFSSIGDGLTDTEATALYNAVQTFQTSLSRQV